MWLQMLRVLGVPSEEESGSSLLLDLTTAGRWQKAAVVPLLALSSPPHNPNPAPSPKSWVGSLTVHFVVLSLAGPWAW